MKTLGTMVMLAALAALTTWGVVFAQSENTASENSPPCTAYYNLSGPLPLRDPVQCVMRQLYFDEHGGGHVTIHRRISTKDVLEGMDRHYAQRKANFEKRMRERGVLATAPITVGPLIIGPNR